MSERTVGIGLAAALFRLAPSALRWWERQGVLPSPRRTGAHRRYDEADLRRIGVAYLCHVTGRMPLAEARIVANGGLRNHRWKRAVRDQVLRLEAELDQLTAARDYLSHLLDCHDGDMATQCPYLPDELIKHTPRGEIAEPDLIKAARRARSMPGRRPVRDETAAVDDETLACEGCGQMIRAGLLGRPRRHCSAACRQRAYRRRRMVVPTD
ncbi:MerR family transcriptional regulator [Microlunatus speluncae]|uniref:helix-turn-helix domain-containing protein n=1 Tax=Microlunatus speluncae TaxID=2594267 RepID=UPI001C2DBFC5|nr:MerR family transcriptional regulator [Microlunatus speluncae]